MDALTGFGLFAVTFMLICYMLEDRAPVWTLLFALGCLLDSCSIKSNCPLPVRAELVEALPFFIDRPGEGGRHFDKLSANGER